MVNVLSRSGFRAEIPRCEAYVSANRSEARFREDDIMQRRIDSAAVRGMLAVLCGGAVLASSCSNAEFQAAVLSGVNAATDSLLSSSQDNDISFLDWVESEFND